MATFNNNGGIRIPTSQQTTVVLFGTGITGVTAVTVRAGGMVLNATSFSASADQLRLTVGVPSFPDTVDQLQGDFSITLGGTVFTVAIDLFYVVSSNNAFWTANADTFVQKVSQFRIPLFTFYQETPGQKWTGHLRSGQSIATLPVNGFLDPLAKPTIVATNPAYTGLNPGLCIPIYGTQQPPNLAEYVRVFPSKVSPGYQGSFQQTDWSKVLHTLSPVGSFAPLSVVRVISAGLDGILYLSPNDVGGVSSPKLRYTSMATLGAQPALGAAAPVPADLDFGAPPNRLDVLTSPTAGNNLPMMCGTLFQNKYYTFSSKYGAVGTNLALTNTIFLAVFDLFTRTWTETALPIVGNFPAAIVPYDSEGVLMVLLMTLSQPQVSQNGSQIGTSGLFAINPATFAIRECVPLSSMDAAITGRGFGALAGKYAGLFVDTVSPKPSLWTLVGDAAALGGAGADLSLVPPVAVFFSPSANATAIPPTGPVQPTQPTPPPVLPGNPPAPPVTPSTPPPGTILAVLPPVVTPGNPPPQVPQVPFSPGVGFPDTILGDVRDTDRALPTVTSKHVPYEGKFTSKTFNTKHDIMYGANGRIRGLVVTPNAANTLVSLTTPGAFVVGGVIVFYPASASITPVAVAGAPPYALTAFTPDETAGSPITFAVEAFNPVALANKAILATTDNTGFNWTPTVPLGIVEIRDLATAKQLTDEEVRLLTGQDGTIEDANTMHKHRGLITDKVVFETLTGLDFDKFPHVPKGTNPVSADSLHTHKNLLTDNEIENLTGRGGVTAADTEHTHATLPSAEGFAAVFGGPNSDASAFHTHEALKRAHGNVINETPTIWYAPQNKGNAVATINATKSSFTGSIQLVLGEQVTGAGLTAVNGRIIGVRYKQFAAEMYATVTSNIGGNPNVGSAVPNGDPALDPAKVGGITELFNAQNPSGVTTPKEFNQTFTWRGIELRVDTPSVNYKQLALPTPPDDPDGDSFVYHSIIATTSLITPDGQPGCIPSGIISTGAQSGKVFMHERMLSRAAFRLVPVLDPRFPEKGYWTMPYI